MLDAESIESYRTALLERRATLQPARTESADSAESVELDQSRIGRVSRVDALQQAAMHAAAQQLRGAELAGITRALQRIETQTYGWCLQCGEPIVTARLDVNPAAEYCVGCAEQRER